MYINGFCFNDAYFDAWLYGDYFVDFEFDAFNNFAV